MTRYVDTLPTPTHVEPKKLIVLSAPRTGTHGLYLALKKLGFKPYHMAEVLKAGPTAIQLLYDGLDAEIFHQGKPCNHVYIEEPSKADENSKDGRAEFDKWFANYDIIIEMPFFMIQSTVKAYPDAKFLLVERNPEKWAKSFVNTVGRMHTALTSFPMSLFKYFDSFSAGMSNMSRKLLGFYSYGYGLSPEGQRIAEVKRTVPPEQLKVCKLEDGFGWEQVCPYLGVPVPNFDWPSRNTPEEFFEITGPKLKMAFVKGLIGTTSILAPFVAAGIWYVKWGRMLL
ncbi:hypothetical protein AAE478_001980 [Parahypoxylon ruwenzoriense]